MKLRMVLAQALWNSLLSHFKEESCLVEGPLQNLRQSLIQLPAPKTVSLSARALLPQLIYCVHALHCSTLPAPERAQDHLARSAQVALCSLPLASVTLQAVSQPWIMVFEPAAHEVPWVQRYDPRAFALKGSAGAPRMADLPRGPRMDRPKRPAAAANGGSADRDGAAAAGHPLPLSQNSFAIEPLRSQANWDASSNGRQSFATQVRSCSCIICARRRGAACLHLPARCKQVLAPCWQS